MRFNNHLNTDQELIERFLTTLGGGFAVLSSRKNAQPDFFIFAHDFIREYIEDDFFRKEELFFNALEDSGFPGDVGPIGSMRSEQGKSHVNSDAMLSAAKYWQDTGEEARADLVWSASEYTSTLRQHLKQLNTLIFPLLEQNLSDDEENKIVEEINNIVSESTSNGDADKLVRLVDMLENKLSGWQ